MTKSFLKVTRLWKSTSETLIKETISGWACLTNKNIMFGLFKKKSQIEKLQETYKKTLEQYHKISQINRTEADKLMAEADEIGKKIDELKKQQAG